MRNAQIAILVSLTINCAAQENCPALKDDPTARFQVSGGTVSLPSGAFLLVRRDGHIGALRLTALNLFGGIGEGTSTYESYFQSDSSKPFLAQTAKRRTGNVRIKPLNFLLFQTGPDRARIGKWSFRFITPHSISMWTYRGSQRDYGFEFAGTSACSPDEIDQRQTGLRWFKFEQNQGFALPVSTQPK